MKKIYKNIILVAIFLGAVAASLVALQSNVKQPTTKVAKIIPKPTAVLTPTPTPLQNITLPMVMYHYVENVVNPVDTIRIKLDTNPALFNSQLMMLKDNNYETYFVKDLPKILDGKITPASNSIILTFDDGYEDFYTDAFPILKKYKYKSTIYIVSKFINKKGYMTQKELQEIQDSGIVEIGAHTLSHPDLRYLSLNKAQDEIVSSKVELEKMFSINVETFAYPGGGYNDNVIDIVKKAGYTVAVTTKPGITIKRDSLLTVKRIRPGFLTILQIKSFFKNFQFK